jgi:hypothetical protein
VFTNEPRFHDNRSSHAVSYSPAQGTIPESAIQCEACETDGFAPGQTLHFCYACDFTFCDQCWTAQLVHRKKGPGISAIVHEKTNPLLAKKVQKALSPPSDEQEYAKLCAQDEHASWFGVNRQVGENELLKFRDTGRYSEIMANTKEGLLDRQPSSDSVGRSKFSRDNRTPSLVSFVGQSGAGKSTLINLLIAIKASPGKPELPTPVVGITGRDDVPTSQDVHLYSDPATITSETPLLFADCEGLEGGEREPVMSKHQSHSQRSHVPYPTPRTQYSTERDIVWADTPGRRSRQFAVTHLYPRLLYTFSDTIVFVLKNPR